MKKSLGIQEFNNNKGFFLLLSVILGMLFTHASHAMTLGTMASTITGSFEQLTKLITATSYLGGIAFFIGAIMKFKQHKDSPTQIQIGQPIGLTFIGASLLFLPTMLDIAGATMFGASGGSVAGPTGVTIS